MASTKNIQLLRMPSLVKEQDYKKPLAERSSLNQSNEIIKLLKLPQQPPEFKAKPINLVQIPIKQSHGNEISLIKLPKPINQAQVETKKPLLIDMRNVQNSDFASKKKQIKLLKMPSQKQKMEMIRLPLQRYNENKRETSRLINIPINEKADHNNEKSNGGNNDLLTKRTTAQESKTVKNVLKDCDEGFQKFVKARESEKMERKQLKRKRGRKGHLVKNGDMKSHQKKSNKFAEKNIHGSIRVSQETQTSPSSGTAKKVRKSRQKVNLMTLLEQAAFLFDSDVSDEEAEAQLLGKRSHVVDEDAFSRTQHLKYKKHQNKEDYTSNYIKTNFTTSRHDQPKSSEQLLLENFDKDRSVNSLSLMENSELAKFLAKPTTNEQVFRNKQAASSSSKIEIKQNDIDRQLSDKTTRRPKCSTGLAWQDVINLTRETQHEDTSSSIKKESKGIQVMEPKIERNSKEQVSQTDFTFSSNLNELLLDHHQHLLLKPKSPKRSEKLPIEKKSDYPWEYIGKESMEGLGNISESNKLQHREKATILKEETGKELLSEDDPNYAKRSEAITVEHDWKKRGVQREVSIPMDTRVVQPASGLHFPSDILLEMRIEKDHIETKEKTIDPGSKLLSVMDVAKPVEEIPREIAPEARLIVENEVPFEKLSEAVDITGRQVVNDDEHLNETLRTSADDFRFSDEEKPATLIREEILNTGENERHQRSQIEFESQKLDRVLAIGPKDRIHSNLRNLSVQLDALGDLHDHLERELKNSALLMQTVDTLHHGFFEPVQPTRRVKPKISKGSNVEHKRKELIYFQDDDSQKKRVDVQDVASDIAFNMDMPYISLPAKEEGEMERKEVIENAVESLNSEVSKVESQALHTEDDSVVNSSQGSSNLNEENLTGSEITQSDLTSVPDSPSSPDIIDENGNEVAKLGLGGTESRERGTEEFDVINEYDEIRMRLSERYPKLSQMRIEEDRQNKEREIKEKLENKRKALQDWMKKKKSERHKMYQAEISEKRQRETRPFVASKNTSSSPLKERERSGKENRNQKIFKEGLFQDRMKEASSLMNDILATKSKADEIEKSRRVFSVPTKTKKRKRNEQSIRMKKGKKLTHNSQISSSKEIRKPFNNNGEKSAERKMQYRELREKADKKWLIDNISPSWKDYSFGNDSRNLQITSAADDHIIEDVILSDLEASLAKPALTSSRNKFRRSSNDFRLDLSQLSDRNMSGMYSGRSMPQHSLEGKDFVTEISMEQYRMKNARLLKKSLREYSGNSMEISDPEKGELNPVPFDYSFMTTLEMTVGDSAKKSNRYSKNRNSLRSREDGLEVGETQKSNDKELGVMQRIDTNRSSIDAKDINEILTQYGLLDDGIYQQNNSETSQLLAEANQILENASDEEEAVTLPKNDSVDWEQVDMILKRY